MKILHTSDIHLVEFNDERWKALIKIIELAKKENVDILVISGDLFDKSSNAEFLKNEVRKLFTGNSFKIALIPGNHDYKAFSKGVFFGKDVIYKNNIDMPVFSTQDIDLWEMPFESINEAELLKKLKRMSRHIDNKKVNILLFHGELIDAFYSGSDYGEEGESNYMPVRLTYFENLGFKYILAGHFHKRFDVKNPSEGVYFVYPGSPISITKKEIGKRSVNLFEVGDPPEEYEIDTPYYEIKEITIIPGDSVDPISLIKSKIENNENNVRLILKVNGYIDSNRLGYGEDEFYRKVDDILENKVYEKIIEVNDISSIINDELYRDFFEQVNNSDIDDKDKEDIKDIVMKAFIKIR